VFRFPLPPQPAHRTAPRAQLPWRTRPSTREAAAPDNGTLALTRVTYKKGNVAPKTTALAPEIKHYVERCWRRPIGAHLAVTCTCSCSATYHKLCSRHWCSVVVSRISRCRSLFCIFGKKLARCVRGNKRLPCVTFAGLSDTRMTSP